MAITLKLATEQSLYFLAPEHVRSNAQLTSASTPENAPDDQICTSGILSVRVVGRPRTIRQLSITFSSVFNLMYPPSERHRSRTLYSKTLNLRNAKDMAYPVGEHYFAFSFFLPHTMAPSDESANISLRHRIRAKATVAGRFHDRDQEAVLPVRLVANDNAAICEMPEALLCTVESHSEHLGPYRCDLYSDSLTIGSLLRIKLSVAGVLPVTLISIRGQIEERVEIGSKTMQKPVYKMDKQKHRFCTLDAGKKHLLQDQHPGSELPVIDSYSSPNKQGPGQEEASLATVKEGQSPSFTFLARLPNCKAIRASTVEGSDTPIRVSHALSLDVRYRASDGSSRVMSIYKRVQIASCTCITESIALPPYEEQAHSTPKGNNSLCACGFALEDLVSASHAFYDSSDDSASSASSSPPVTPLSFLSEEEPITFPSTFKSGSCTLEPQIVRDVLG